MNKSEGYTLVELLVALAIGVVVLYGVSTTYVGSLQTSAAAIRTAQFDQEVRATMNLITRDLRRAGYSGTALNDVGQNTFTNPFLGNSPSTYGTGEMVRLWSGTTGTTAISFNDTTQTGTCVTYAYDINGNGSIDTNEYLGFKYDATNNAVQKRTGVTGGGVDLNCTQGNWSALTSTDVTVTALNFKWVDYTNTTDTPASTPTSSPAGCASAPLSGDSTKVQVRVLQVTLSAQSAKDSALKRYYVDFIRMRNNAYDACGNS